MKFGKNPVWGEVFLKKLASINLIDQNFDVLYILAEITEAPKGSNTHWLNSVNLHLRNILAKLKCYPIRGLGEEDF